MNNKARYLNQIADVVVECCSTQIDGDNAMTREELLGESRKENVVMSRCILVMLILTEGFSVTTLANLLHRSPHAIRNLQKKGIDYLRGSRAFRIACSEATLSIEKIRGQLGCS